MPFHFQKYPEEAYALPLKNFVEYFRWGLGWVNTYWYTWRRGQSFQCYVFTCQSEAMPTSPAPPAVLVFLHPQWSSYPPHNQIPSHSSHPVFLNTLLIFLISWTWEVTSQPQHFFLQWISWFVTSAIGGSNASVLHLFLSLKYSLPLLNWNL